MQGRGQTVFIVRPYEGFHERVRPQDFCFYGYALYCPPTTLGNQDYHEHISGASFQTGYYWGQAVNFEALPPVSLAVPTPYNHPFLVREDTAQAGPTFRPIKPLKIENSYLFERLRANNDVYLFEQSQFPGAGAAFSTRTWT